MSVDKNTYELTYIVNSVISDDQIKDLVSRVTAYVSESGAEIIEVEEWGTRRLAYPIQKKRNGYYVNMYFRANGSLIGRLERALEIDDNILRYLTLSMDAKMIRHYEKRKAADPSAPGLIADDSARASKERDADRRAKREENAEAVVAAAAVSGDGATADHSAAEVAPADDVLPDAVVSEAAVSEAAEAPEAEVAIGAAEVEAAEVETAEVEAAEVEAAEVETAEVEAAEVETAEVTEEVAAVEAPAEAVEETVEAPEADIKTEATEEASVAAPEPPAEEASENDSEPEAPLEEPEKSE